MKAIVAGGTGFIGKAICRELVSAGYEVMCLSRDPKAAPDLQIPGGTGRLSIVEWDARSFKQWLPHVNLADCIINLQMSAGSGRRLQNRPPPLPGG